MDTCKWPASLESETSIQTFNAYASEVRIQALPSMWSPGPAWWSSLTWVDTWHFQLLFENLLVFMLRVFDRGKCSQGWGNVGHERARSWSDSFWDFLTCIHTFDTTLSQESNSNSQLSILIVTRVAGLPTKGLLPSSSPGYLWGRFPLHEMTQMDQMKSRLKGWGMPLAPAHPQWLPVFEKVENDPNCHEPTVLYKIFSVLIILAYTYYIRRCPSERTLYSSSFINCHSVPQLANAKSLQYINQTNFKEGSPTPTAKTTERKLTVISGTFWTNHVFSTSPVWMKQKESTKKGILT